MFDDFKDLLSAFNAAKVRYLIVGGYAVSLHAQPRATKDLDILIGTDAENSKAVYIALTKFGAPVDFISRDDLLIAKMAAGRAQDLADVDALRESAKQENFEQHESWNSGGDRSQDHDESAPTGNPGPDLDDEFAP
jgi:hypothetical protein